MKNLKNKNIKQKYKIKIFKKMKSLCGEMRNIT